MTWNAWVNLILGILLIVSPFVVGFSGDVRPTWTAIVAGIVVAVVSASQGLATRRRTGPHSMG